MLEVYLIAGVVVVATVVTHAVGTTLLVRQLRRHLERPDAGFKDGRAMPAQIWAVFALTLLHVVEIHLWALAYLMAIPGDQTDTFEKVVYFSFVTFTTLGYGDIVLQGPERTLTGIEALNGMLLIGWSVGRLALPGRATRVEGSELGVIMSKRAHELSTLPARCP